ncbi:hypothetical protein ACOME3_004783 [Neoechinorhynchus agilis]
MEDGHGAKGVDVGVDYPLIHKWSLWVRDPDPSSSSSLWDSDLRKLCTVGTVIEFWRLLNHVKLPRHLPRGCDYYFFRDGIKPTWEDPMNVDGGSWILVIRQADELDSIWLETLMALIGSQLEKDGSDLICGVRFQIRSNANSFERKDKVTLWTRFPDDAAAQESIALTWKEIAGIKSFLQYDRHGTGNASDKNGKLYTLK